MDELRNDRLLRALARQPVDATPVWIMRQAGRYLPEYRATRERAGSFEALCRTPELACAVTLQPLERFELDAAILFSDILTVPDAMGLGLRFVEGEGPIFDRPVREERDIARLPVPDPETELAYVMDAIRLVRRELGARVPLIGFAGSPWTLATYMVEGGSSRTYALTKTLLYERPELLHRLLATTAEAVAAYLSAQVAAGAQALMIFDTWGGVLTPRAYREFSLAYMQRILTSIPRQAGGRRIPAVLFTKGGGQWLEAMADAGCDAIGLDWTTELGEARARVGDRTALQGNMDPAVLYASPEAIEREARTILGSFGAGPGHVFNLGHGIAPDVDPHHVAALVDAVHRLSLPYHRE
ncbi:MAG: uroporphyrinogen decarboxylase [Gammaproteobacteria bacterium]|nr:uroporphyrinogen decarboxylase [Gammaproteobacteria bacterium]